ncbi:hypothetical protein, partial [Staphylococcus xylosus]
ATKFYKNKENVNFYIISIEIDVYSLIRDIYVPDSFFILRPQMFVFVEFDSLDFLNYAKLTLPL